MSEEETKRDICPTCHRPHVSVEDQVATVLAERDHKTAMEKATAIAEQARAENAQLKVQLTEAQKLREPETQDIPDFADVLEHCESGKCPVHAKALQDYREKVAGEVKINLAKPENKSHLLDVMKAAGVEEMPSKVVITGLGERSLRR